MERISCRFRAIYGRLAQAKLNWSNSICVVSMFVLFCGNVTCIHDTGDEYTRNPEGHNPKRGPQYQTNRTEIDMYNMLPRDTLDNEYDEDDLGYTLPSSGMTEDEDYDLRHGSDFSSYMSPSPLPSGMFQNKPRRKTGMEYSTVFHTAKGSFNWPYREQVAFIPGNITLGGLMMVHERDEKVICGKIMPQGGLQAAEVMLYTIEQINRMQLIPGVTLGARIKDDCDRDIYGLEQSVTFIRGM